MYGNKSFGSRGPRTKTSTDNLTGKLKYHPNLITQVENDIRIAALKVPNHQTPVVNVALVSSNGSARRSQKDPTRDKIPNGLNFCFYQGIYISTILVMDFNRQNHRILLVCVYKAISKKGVRVYFCSAADRRSPLLVALGFFCF